ncbi:MFS transporter [Amycolatopsis pithecellobii]|uniref:MFS transporter n=1 Tax=Amycolatopsis pithecellobii TaxID=664692 RepID=A0A6N7YW79_9PSEU|nr:MFS transporter [Amycolatopsis pithecellobii]MTD57337.1 MFS transporter [Amycolatopsis pithecellobii]
MSRRAPVPPGPISPTATPAFNWRVPALISLAVFAQESTWNFYDAQVPPLIQHYVSNAALIGLLMGLDNLVGVFVQPWMGSRSDRTRTRWGRRIPYLVVGAPIAAVLFSLVPFATSLPVLLLTMFSYGLVANTYKPVAEALMPDFVAAEHRSKANAITRIGTSLTIIVSALVSLLFVDKNIKIAFAIPATMMVVCVAVVALTVKERDSPGYRQALADRVDNKDEADQLESLRGVLKELLRDPDRRRLWMIAGVFLMAGAWGASRALMTTYGINVLGMTAGSAGGIALPGGLAVIGAALPLALLSDRIGRLRVIRWGMVVFIVAMLLGAVIRTPAGVIAATLLGSAGYAAYTVNAVVVMWDLAPSHRAIGAYTALYGVANATGNSLGPTIVGSLVTFTGWPFFLLDVAVVAFIAFLALTRVSRTSAVGVPADGLAESK